VSRWRQDLYFTIASIQDFQRIENGKMNFEYNANPLIVPQICMRFTDTSNVGLTGRHLTSFMMAGQHAFNYPKEGYWRDRTIEDAFVVFSLNPDGGIESARMAAVSPLADFSFDYQDLLLKPAEKKP